MSNSNDRLSALFPETPHTDLLLMTDPQSFMALVVERNPEKRVKSHRTLDDLVTCEALHHGIFCNADTLASLVHIYTQLFLLAPVVRRRTIYEHVKVIVPQLGGEFAGAFTPFMMIDPNAGIVSTATIDYVSLGSLQDSDPMTRVKDVVRIIEQGRPENPAAVIGGLLALGDPRVCLLVKPLREGLSAEDVTTVNRCYTGLTAKCVVEFYIDWLETLIDRRDEEGESIFGNVAAGLYNMGAARKTPFVLDGLRPFPVPQDKSAGWPDILRIDPHELSASIASRLYELERREQAPKVIPHVLLAFGLKPKTP